MSTKKPMTPAQALRAWNADPKNEEARGLMLSNIGQRAVIERDAGGKIRVDETMDRLAFALEHSGNDDQAGCVSPASLFAEAKPQTEADPIDRRPLRKGKTLTNPVVDWSAVVTGRREVAGYAAESSQVPPGGSEVAAYHLAQPQLQPPWPRLDAEWAAIADKKRPTPAERELVQRVRDRLFVQETSARPAVYPGPAGSITQNVGTLDEQCERVWINECITHFTANLRGRTFALGYETVQWPVIGVQWPSWGLDRINQAVADHFIKQGLVATPKQGRGESPWMEFRRAG